MLNPLVKNIHFLSNEVITKILPEIEQYRALVKPIMAYNLKVQNAMKSLIEADAALENYQNNSFDFVNKCTALDKCHQELKKENLETLSKKFFAKQGYITRAFNMLKQVTTQVDGIQKASKNNPVVKEALDPFLNDLQKLAEEIHKELEIQTSMPNTLENIAAAHVMYAQEHAQFVVKRKQVESIYKQGSSTTFANSKSATNEEEQPVPDRKNSCTIV